MWRLATGTPMLSAICCWLIVIVYFAAGPRPRRLCLRGLRRSALRRSTSHFHNDSVADNRRPPRLSRHSRSVTPMRSRSRFRVRSGSRLPPPVPSRHFRMLVGPHPHSLSLAPSRSLEPQAPAARHCVDRRSLAGRSVRLVSVVHVMDVGRRAPLNEGPDERHDDQHQPEGHDNGGAGGQIDPERQVHAQRRHDRAH